MNTRKARKAIPHRLQDVITCLKWRRFVRLHLASNLLTELCTVVEHGSRNKVERANMKAMKAAILCKDWKTLEIMAKSGFVTFGEYQYEKDGAVMAGKKIPIVDNGINMMGESK
jgi:hypothetical protein